MDPSTAIAAFSLAALVLALTPGLDTALVLRTATVDGPADALRASAGICLGTLVWGGLTGLGLGALVAVSSLAYALLQMAGAAYLVWLGVGMARAACRRDDITSVTRDAASRAGTPRWFLRGLMTNLLNPKVGVFYVSLLPQFIPTGASVAAFSIGLAGIHAAIGFTWFAVLVVATRPLKRALQQPAVTRTLDGVTGALLIGLGLKLALVRG